jgi:ATP-binding cassette subfamily C (CFTR/MRP) protein 1
VLKAEVAFTALALFNIIRFPMQALPSVISQTIEAYVSLGRIEGFLLKPDLDPKAVLTAVDAASPYAIEIQSATFKWATPPKKDADAKPAAGAAAAAAGDAAGKKKKVDKKKAAAEAAEAAAAAAAAAAARPPTLKNINLKIRRGAFAAIVGEVGSGKSSLLHALLGEIPKESGTVRVGGRMAYMAQQPWIQNASVKNNILFGDEYDAERYARALEVCQLTRDLASLPNGDSTEIGERGINLSGGQKARIQMARAVYNNVDIFLMDDPLSAVDAHVGAALFEGCMCHTLHGRTRVLVTHQLQYLSHCDQIIVLRDGAVVEDGTYQELMARRGQFAALIDKFVNTTDDVPESPMVDDPDDAKQAASSSAASSSAAPQPAAAAAAAAVTEAANRRRSCQRRADRPSRLPAAS